MVLGMVPMGKSRERARINLVERGLELRPVWLQKVPHWSMVWEGPCQAKDGVKLKKTPSAGDSALPHVDRQEPGQKKAELWAEQQP